MTSTAGRYIAHWVHWTRLRTVNVRGDHRHARLRRARSPRPLATTVHWAHSHCRRQVPAHSLALTRDTRAHRGCHSPALHWAQALHWAPALHWGRWAQALHWAKALALHLARNSIPCNHVPPSQPRLTQLTALKTQIQKWHTELQPLHSLPFPPGARGVRERAVLGRATGRWPTGWVRAFPPGARGARGGVLGRRATGRSTGGGPCQEV